MNVSLHEKQIKSTKEQQEEKIDEKKKKYKWKIVYEKLSKEKYIWTYVLVVVARKWVKYLLVTGNMSMSTILNKTNEGCLKNITKSMKMTD